MDKWNGWQQYHKGQEGEIRNTVKRVLHYMSCGIMLFEGGHGLFKGVYTNSSVTTKIFFNMYN